MKTEVITPKDKPKFPLLAKEKNSKAILMFVSKNKAMVLVGYDGRPSAIQDNNWSDIDGGNWEILPAGTQVILTQE